MRISSYREHAIDHGDGAAVANKRQVVHETAVFEVQVCAITNSDGAAGVGKALVECA